MQCLWGVVVLAALPLAGCKGPGAAAPSSQVRAEQRAELETEREQMDLIPPPSKTRYMAIHSFESWENPYLTVQPGMLELHITLEDANTTPIGVGGMLRPVGARRQELNIDLDKVGEAMSSVPQDAWPYGRVVAIEEAHKTPPSAEPVVRRNLERTIRTLNELGVVVYDLSSGSSD
jgi:hypothetical protein